MLRRLLSPKEVQKNYVNLMAYSSYVTKEKNIEIHA